MRVLVALAAICLLFNLQSWGQTDTIKPDPGLFFSDINPFFQHEVNGNLQPQTSFGVSTALMGFKKSFAQKVTGTIIYDVTRTTNFTYPDSIGINGYFEGSKYTAFLKMAEIDWKFTKWGEFGFGQLLNEQYLTIQDKHWGMRYVATTMQEFFRFGNPADFGARLKLMPWKKLTVSLAAMNGEGPFRYQDNESLMQFCGNIEFRPKDFLILKVYGDIQQHPAAYSKPRSAISGFFGFKNKTWTAGAEYSVVLNNSYADNTDLSGISVYGIRKLNEKTAVFARADLLTEYGSVENELFILAGVEYRPVKNLGLAVNVKRNTWLNTTQLCLNAGIRF